MIPSHIALSMVPVFVQHPTEINIIASVCRGWLSMKKRLLIDWIVSEFPQITHAQRLDVVSVSEEHLAQRCVMLHRFLDIQLSHGTWRLYDRWLYDESPVFEHQMIKVAMEYLRSPQVQVPTDNQQMQRDRILLTYMYDVCQLMVNKGMGDRIQPISYPLQKTDMQLFTPLEKAFRLLLETVCAFRCMDPDDHEAVSDYYYTLSQVENGYDTMMVTIIGATFDDSEIDSFKQMHRTSLQMEDYIRLIKIVLHVMDRAEAQIYDDDDSVYLYSYCRLLLHPLANGYEESDTESIVPWFFTGKSINTY